MIQRKDYEIENYTAEIAIEEYKKDCIDVEEFINCCKACKNYNRVWSCPPYDFSPYEYWNRYESLFLYGRKILFSSEMTKQTYQQEDLWRLTDTILEAEKQDMAAELFAMEKQYPDSVSLSAGCCMLCGRDGCTRQKGLPCVRPESMRYSIESLGGNVGLTITRYLHQELLWMEEGKLPDYFILVAGLLKK